MPLTLRPEMDLAAFRIIVLTCRHAGRDRAAIGPTGTAVAVLVHMEAVLAWRRALQVGDEPRTSIAQASWKNSTRP
jgi:hypothetical protein